MAEFSRIQLRRRRVAEFVRILARNDYEDSIRISDEIRYAPRLVDAKPHSYLRRLATNRYQSHAAVHWAMTMDRRQVGWLSDLFHARFREALLHALARYHLVAPVYCLMPDHFHLLLLGLAPESDQRNAMRFFRRELNRILQPHWRLQKQGYDHALKPEERQRGAFQRIAFYILANPVRAGLISQERHATYPFCGCMVTGYPDLNVLAEGYWEHFWKLYEQLREEPGADSHANSENLS